MNRYSGNIILPCMHGMPNNPIYLRAFLLVMEALEPHQSEGFRSSETSPVGGFGKLRDLTS